MTFLLATLCTLSAVVSSSCVSGVPFPAVPGPNTTDVNIVHMTTASPAQAVKQAIQSDPEVAKAVTDANSTQQLYLLKTVSYATGTAADLDLPPEEALPDGAPDRVEAADITVYSPPVSNAKVGGSQESINGTSTTSDESSGQTTKVQLIPVSL